MPYIRDYKQVLCQDGKWRNVIFGCKPNLQERGHDTKRQAKDEIRTALCGLKRDRNGCIK